MIILQWIYALMGIGCGMLILRHRKTVYEWTGRFYWAEKYLGNGGTVIVITLFALWLILVSVGYPLWAFEGTGIKRTNIWQQSGNGWSEQNGSSTEQPLP